MQTHMTDSAATGIDNDPEKCFLYNNVLKQNVRRALYFPMSLLEVDKLCVSTSDGQQFLEKWLFFCVLGVGWERTFFAKKFNPGTRVFSQILVLGRS